jgi:hypothetical protein
MKYFLLIHADEKDYDKLSPAENQALMERYYAANREMHEAGVYLASDRLRPVATATTVRKKAGRIVLTDGPFAETKEQFGGYFLVDVESLDEALEWAKKIPAVDHGCVEVRPVWENEDQSGPGSCSNRTESMQADRGPRS